MPCKRRSIWFAAAFATLAVLIGAAFLLRPAPAPPRYIGGESCIRCHREQHDQWHGSHHDLAMQPATASAVLGDFNNANFNDGIIKSQFHSSGGKFYINTEGPDGKLADFPVTHTFGVDPLQQYLIDMPGGRKQALTIAWDTASHRWFSLYPNRNIGPDDWLHWTRQGQNWNSNCAECHSTNLQKNYDPPTDTYKTTWSEINVSCEACHGPGSTHVQWADASALSRWWSRYDDSTKGLAVKLRDETRAWGFNADGQPALIRTSNPDPNPQVEACAQCHSRRGPLSTQYVPGQRLLDHYMPQLLQENIYHPDGQILDEDYEYGSFVQSRMYQHGVRCTDCHNPHTAKLLAPATNNVLCIRCHAPARYDTPDHHHHTIGAPGATCVECHMPTRNYMIVDPRRDHSLRIPRPDLSLQIGVPNACNQCHQDKPVKWAADAVEKWYGPMRPGKPHYGPIFAAAWAGEPSAGDALRSLLLDPDRTPFVRASAASALQGYPGSQTATAALQAAADPDPLIRSMAAALLGAEPPAQRVQNLAPLLKDPIRAVRHIAARALLTVPPELIKPDLKPTLDSTIEDQMQSTLAHSDSVAGRMALGGLYQDLGQLDKALEAFRSAAAMDHQNIDAQMALAELYIRLHQDREAEALLTQVLQLTRPPELPQRMWDRARGTVKYQLGLLIASNESRREEGLRYLSEAAELIPRAARLYYNLGELHRSLDHLPEAERAYVKAHELDPGDADTIYVLAALYLQQERWEEARRYARELSLRFPSDPQVQELLKRAAGHP